MLWCKLLLDSTTFVIYAAVFSLNKVWGRLATKRGWESENIFPLCSFEFAHNYFRCKLKINTMGLAIKDQQNFEVMLLWNWIRTDPENYRDSQHLLIDLSYLIEKGYSLCPNSHS
jgi:hypothetical protein